MAFRRKRKAVTTYDDPEALFRDRRNRTVQGPLSHQSDILRRYQEEAFDKPNVALELPTGSGKTLVGLLIAEFRRVTKNERVLYLCPTKQLVLQVCEQSERKYGIIATPFTGKIRDYSPKDKSMYQTSKTIAVAPYSALFNTNPFFDSPNLIILDDAHAAENYIASNWSLRISRIEYEQVYIGILSIIKHLLPISQQQRFLSEEQDEFGVRWIEKIPTNTFISEIPNINEFLNENIKNTKLQYPWSLLHGHLESCHAYISHDQILIRPYIPPSLTHKPFANATQRVFMSATLGLGGDLERTTGIPSFHRLPIPTGWDKQGIGRRYFIFPEMSLEKELIDTLTRAMVDRAGRALILVPSDKKAEKYHQLFNNISICTAKDIEQSKDCFISKEKAVAVLANRYDGIDLLDDHCRLLIIEGIPKAGNLQELFLMSRMAAGNLFNDRIRTRIIQSFGRCTRSATDYAAVCVIGEDFYDWLIIGEKRSLFHPELQGELIFGAEQSSDMSQSEFLENLEIFLDHGKEWEEVDADIRETRDETTQSLIPGQNELFNAASLEVKYQYEIWNQNYEKGAEISQNIVSILSGDSLKGLRGFWYYLAGSASELTARQLNQKEFFNKAEELYNRASACVPAIVWLRTLSTRFESVPDSEIINKTDVLLNSNVERIEMLFEARSYALPRKFEKDVKEILDGLNSDDSNTFEEAHRRLGEILGFESANSNGDATPDPWWISNGDLCLVSEDKNDSNPEHSVPVRHTRQAASHSKWIRDNVNLNPNAEIFIVMITPAVKIHKDVPSFADNVGYWHLDEFRSWALNAIGVMRRLRVSFTGVGQVSWRETVQEALIKNSLDPKSIIELATKKLLRELEIE